MIQALVSFSIVFATWLQIQACFEVICRVLAIKNLPPKEKVGQTIVFLVSVIEVLAQPFFTVAQAFGIFLAHEHCPEHMKDVGDAHDEDPGPPFIHMLSIRSRDGHIGHLPQSGFGIGGDEDQGGEVAGPEGRGECREFLYEPDCGTGEV